MPDPALVGLGTGLSVAAVGLSAFELAKTNCPDAPVVAAAAGLGGAGVTLGLAWYHRNGFLGHDEKDIGQAGLFSLVTGAGVLAIYMLLRGGGGAGAGSNSN